MGEKMSKVDIITTTFRNTEKLKICISSILEKTNHVDYKWYLWCNDPDDEVKKVVYNSLFVDNIMFTDQVVPIYNDSNDGSFSSNNNEAAGEGSSEYILFMNDDIEPLNDEWLVNMVNILDTDSNIGAVGAMLLYPDKKTIQHCGVFFSHRTNNLPFHMHYRQPVDKVKDFISVPRYYQAVTAACMLVRRDDFNSIGGFSTDFFYGFEDVALCLDIKDKLKKRTVYCPFAQLVHHEGISDFSKKQDHPRLQKNILALKKGYADKYFNDYDFYIRDPNFMVYKLK
jgi:GT2 family glycosyltransferase